VGAGSDYRPLFAINACMSCVALAIAVTPGPVRDMSTMGPSPKCRPLGVKK